MDPRAIKLEQFSGVCVTCLGDNVARNIFDVHYFNGKPEICAHVMFHCFKIIISPSNRDVMLMCEKCIHRLEDAYSFKQQIDSSLLLMDKHIESTAVCNEIKKNYYASNDETTTMHIMQNSTVPLNTSFAQNITENRSGNVGAIKNKTVIADGTPKKFKRKRITLKEKLNVLDGLQRGEKLYDIANKFKLNEATIRTIKKNEDKIRNRVSIGSSMSMDQVARIRNTMMARMEKCLIIWIEDCNKKNIPINNQLIKQKSLNIFAHLQNAKNGGETHQSKFVASKGWYDRFKKRFLLNNFIIQGQNASNDAQKFQNELINIVKNKAYTSDQVFNVDKTVLYWKRMPHRTYINKNEISNQDRTSVLICSNANGDHIIKPMIVNQYSNPIEATVSFHWRSNNKALVTDNILRDWFYNCFIPDVENYVNKKNTAFRALLIIDNASSHPTDLHHPNVQIIFSPPNTESIIQDVIKIFKTHYICESLKYIANKLHFDPDMTIMRLWNDLSLLNCIDILESSIKELKSSTINTRWKSIWSDTILENIGSTTTLNDSIIRIAKSLGGDGFEDMNEDDINELIEFELELDEEELVQFTDELFLDGCVENQNVRLKSSDGIELCISNDVNSTVHSVEYKRQSKNCDKPPQSPVLIIKEENDFRDISVDDTETINLSFPNSINMEYSEPDTINNMSINTPEIILETQNESVQNRKYKYNCPICSTRFYTYDARIKHLVEVHNEKKTVYKCDQCSKEYLRSAGLNNHIKKTGHVLLQKCDMDIKIEPKDKPYVCAYCDLPFLHKSSLVGHIDMHRKHVVDKRNKNSTPQSKVKKKISYNCTICPEKFPNYHVRMKHLYEVHKEGRKEYKCHMCSKIYYYSRMNLHKHIKVFHPMKDNLIC